MSIWRDSNHYKSHIIRNILSYAAHDVLYTYGRGDFQFRLDQPTLTRLESLFNEMQKVIENAEVERSQDSLPQWRPVADRNTLSR